MFPELLRSPAGALDVVGEIVIRRPMADVAAFMFDPAREVLWKSAIVESRPLTPGPLAPGARIERVASLLGRRFHDVVEVTDRIEGRFMETTHTSPIAMLRRYDLSEVPHGTWARIRARARGSALMGIAEPLLARMIRRRIEADLDTLKRHLESVNQGVGSPAVG